MSDADPIRRWDVALAAEIAATRFDEFEIAAMNMNREIALSGDAHARAVAVSRLIEREPELHADYIRAFNERHAPRPRRAT